MELVNWTHAAIDTVLVVDTEKAERVVFRTIYQSRRARPSKCRW